MKKTLLALVVLPVFAASAAQAAQIVQTYTIPATTVSFTDTNGIFNQFNPGQGTLNWVDVSLSITDQHSVGHGKNLGALPASGTVDFGVKATLQSPVFADIVTTALTSSGYVNLVTNDTFQVDSNNKTDSNDRLYISPSYAPFIGTGTFSTTIPVESNYSVSGDAISFSTTPGQATGTVTVTYDYNPTPEPASLGLLGLGALGLLKRRRA